MIHSWNEDGAIRRYVDILSNGGFKALFGDINNKDVVMSIMNVLLPPHRQVVDIEYMPTEHQGTFLGLNKDFQYDFMCRDKSGAVFIVEMQRYREKCWFKRCVSYASRAYDRQNRKGESYDVAPVYLIGLMGTEIDHPDVEFWRERYISEYTFLEKECHDLLDETIIIIFAELTRFSKTLSECESDVDRILYLLKNMGRLQNRPVELQAEVYRRLFEACEIAAFTEDKRLKYENDMFDEKRIWGIEAANRELGREEGLAEGRKEGKAEGRAELIRKMHSKGVDAETISEMLDMSLEEVQMMLS